MNRWVRVVMAMLVTAVLAAGCGDGSLSRSRGDTTAPATSSQPITATQIDSLVVPVEQVPGGLHSAGVDEEPKSYPRDPLDACHIADTPSDDVELFGSGTTAFRNVFYSGVGNLFVRQVIAVYPGSREASTVLQRLADGLQTCKTAGNSEVSIDSITPNSVAWHARGFSPVKGMEETSYAAEGRVVKNVVFRVTVGHFDDPRPVAAAVANQISANINDVG